ncbi:MAG: asparagine synthase (glutamine-hydrolyzing), partial [Limisphaerales bacterium]
MDSPGGRVGLGHRRLSIVDLSPAGAQPMLNAAGDLAITFNGEIYNHRELRAELEDQGYIFRSRSDTEVLLHLYAERGKAMVEALRGMYAFAIWDARKQGCFLARDPFGIKPLFFADDGQTFRAASQVKALLAGGGIAPSAEPAGHVGFFIWGYVPAPYTLYRGIRALPAGASLWIDASGLGKISHFCDLTAILAEAEASKRLLSLEETRSRLEAALDDTISHHLVADVPVGVFLSSGIDSTALTASASRRTPGLRTVTLGFDEYRGTPQDETPQAEQTAREFGTDHRTVWVTRTDFNAHCDHLFNSMDQPSIDGVNTYFVSLAAVQSSLKVAISGLGGDELFGGYSSFREIPRLVHSLRALRRFTTVGKIFRVVSSGIFRQFASPKYAGLLEYGTTFPAAYLLRRGLFMPWELPRILPGDMVREGWRELQPLVRLEQTLGSVRGAHARVSALEVSWYMRHQLLRDSDWASMAHSLELRTPLVDVEFFRAMAPLITGSSPVGKQDLALASPRSLPKSVAGRTKTGFSIPVRQWLLDVSSPLGA